MSEHLSDWLEIRDRAGVGPFAAICTLAGCVFRSERDALTIDTDGFFGAEYRSTDALPRVIRYALGLAVLRVWADRPRGGKRPESFATVQEFDPATILREYLETLPAKKGGDDA